GSIFRAIGNDDSDSERSASAVAGRIVSEACGGIRDRAVHDRETPSLLHSRRLSLPGIDQAISPGMGRELVEGCTATVGLLRSVSIRSFPGKAENRFLDPDSANGRYGWL